MTKTASRRPLSVGAALGLTFLLSIAFICFFAARWFVAVYGRIGFDSILFTLQSSLSGVQSDLVRSYLLNGLLPALVCTALSCAILLALRKLSAHRMISIVTAIALSAGLLGYAAVDVELVDYVHGMFFPTNLYEDEYVDPNGVSVTFPEEKRNLVYIMLESMETVPGSTYSSS